LNKKEPKGGEAACKNPEKGKGYGRSKGAFSTWSARRGNPEGGFGRVSKINREGLAVKGQHGFFETLVGAKGEKFPQSPPRRAFSGEPRNHEKKERERPPANRTSGGRGLGGAVGRWGGPPESVGNLHYGALKGSLGGL